jgi:hypothetical protein
VFQTGARLAKHRFQIFENADGLVLDIGVNDQAMYGIERDLAGGVDEVSYTYGL